MNEPTHKVNSWVLCSFGGRFYKKCKFASCIRLFFGVFMQLSKNHIFEIDPVLYLDAVFSRASDDGREPMANFEG